MLVLAARLLALGTALGGPMFLFDLLKANLGAPYAFAIAFLPVGAILLGALSLDDDPNERVSHWFVTIGIAGVFALLALNVFTLAQLVRASPPSARWTNGVGIVIGTFTSGAYLRLAIPFRRGIGTRSPVGRELASARHSSEWLLLVVCLAFTAAGVWLLGRKPSQGIFIIALFGSGVLLAASKLGAERSGRSRPAGTAVTGGRTFRPSRTRTFLVFAWLVALASAFLNVAPDAGPVALGLGLFLGAVGVAGLMLVLLRVLPVGSLRLDPPGLTLGHRKYSLFVPWHAIASARAGEVQHNGAVLISLIDPELIQVSPESFRAQAFESIGTSVAWFGAHLVIMTSVYGLDPVLVASAVERCAADPSARSALRGPPLD